MMTVFQLVQTIYWASLSTWFGGVLFVALAAPVVFRTVREFNPILPTVLSVNLENEHGSLLGGAIVGNILRMLSGIQLGCAAAVALSMIGQWFVMSDITANRISSLIRAVLLVGAAGMVAYDRWMLWPKMWDARQEYIDHADEPDLANPAKDEFDALHRESVRVLFIILGLLSLIVVMGAGITPRIFLP
jgi:hypothetical protein